MITAESILEKYRPLARTSSALLPIGRVTRVAGLLIESVGPYASIGEICMLRNQYGEDLVRCEIVGFRDNTILSMPLGEIRSIEPGMEIAATSNNLQIAMSNSLLGRVIDGLGNPIDGKDELPRFPMRSIYAHPINPLARKRITEHVETGVRVIDGLLTLGKGQRVGIFAGSGVGKSTIMGMIARNTNADVNVIALIGERGREVRDFIEKDLGEDGLKRSVVVVATSDMPPLLRIKAALTATAIAEYFRDEGLDAMLMMDSVTRLAMAQREVGLSIGEPPTTKGYTPSVFAMMPQLMERAGMGAHGSISALYTVLVEGDDMNEPIADTARGILDGHIVLSRKLAAKGHYPAIDVLNSISRLSNDVTTYDHRLIVRQLKEMMAAYQEAEDLISVGAYQRGNNSLVDKAIDKKGEIDNFLRQEIDEYSSFRQTIEYLGKII